MKKRKNKNKQGFTLIEILVAIFVFTVMMLVSLAVFTSMFRSYRMTKNLQENLDTANYAINQMSGVIRNSKLITSGGIIGPDSIQLYNYFSGKCYQYKFLTGKLYVRNDGVYNDTDDTCSFSGVGDGDKLTSGYVFGKFDVIETIVSGVTSQRGKVLISLNVCQDSGDIASCLNATSDSAKIQTTVSLRDYGEIVK